jgi:hypothetical protein
MNTSILMTTLLLSILAAPALSHQTDSANSSLASAPSRSHFVGLQQADLAAWTRSPGEKTGEIMLTSPPLSFPLHWNELVVSWNAALPANAYLTIEARGLYTKNAAPYATKFYVLGRWSGDTKQYARQSVNGQADGDGDVQTDTLILKQRGAQVQIRLRLGDTSGTTETSEALIPLVRFLGLALLDNTFENKPRPANRVAWGKTIAVPERFQNDFRDLGGAVWCSPTSVSMILAYWSGVLQRPELTMTIPQVAQAVHDPQWPGTGNWVFNTAFAGSFPNLRAYVTRFNDLNDVEAWIAAGVPVALSVNYGLLKGEKSQGGHLVVCNGFTANGDVIIADPGRKPKVGEKYRVFPRKDVIAGWGASHNTVYLIYPESLAPPANSHNWHNP